MKTKHLRLMQRAYVILFFCFMYLPIAYMVVFSFNQSKGYALFTGFTFKWYTSLLHNESILHALWVSLYLALFSAVIATVLGTAASLGIASMGRKSRLLVTNITYITTVNPEIITGISLMMLFVAYQRFASELDFLPDNIMGFPTLLIAHITFDAPYVILSVMPRLRQTSNSLYEAALDLGATPSTALRKVILPQIMPGVISGAIMSWVTVISELSSSIMLYRASTQTLTVAVYTEVIRDCFGNAAAYSTVLTFTSVLSLLLFFKLTGRRDISV
mgnify:CR=1 FL=1